MFQLPHCELQLFNITHSHCHTLAITPNNIMSSTSVNSSLKKTKISSSAEIALHEGHSPPPKNKFANAAMQTLRHHTLLSLQKKNYSLKMQIKQQAHTIDYLLTEKQSPASATVDICHFCFYPCPPRQPTPCHCGPTCYGSFACREMHPERFSFSNPMPQAVFCRSTSDPVYCSYTCQQLHMKRDLMQQVDRFARLQRSKRKKHGTSST